MRNALIYFVVAIAVLGGFFWSRQPSEEVRKKFVFGFIPSEQAEVITPKAEKLARLVSEKMGVEIEVVVPTEYEPLIEGLKFGHIDAAYMDGGPAWLASTKAHAEVVLAELKDGQPYYFAEMFVKKGSDIRELSDVVGKKIAFTSWTGSSGFIMPVGTLIQSGIVNPNGNDFIALEKSLHETFGGYTISGGYKQSLELLINNKADVIGGPHDLAQRFLDEQHQDDIVSIQRFGKVPSHTILVGEHVTDALKKSFTDAMLELNIGENSKILDDLYGVQALVAINTQDHLGDFGPVFDAVSGIHGKIISND